MCLQASVHRTRHAGLKRNDATVSATNGTTAAIVHTPGNTTMPSTGAAAAATRPTYQQYQQQRRMQFQQQQQQQLHHQQNQQKQLQLQQPYYSVNIANLPKSKGGGPTGTGPGSGGMSVGPGYDIQHQQMQIVNHPSQNQQHFMHAGSMGNSAGNGQQQQQQQRLNNGQIQQPQQETKLLNSQAISRIPIQHQKMQPHLQQHAQHQQQQQQHLPGASTFNHISKNATNLLNDIYERNLLSHTTFAENEQQQFLLQQQQQQQHHHQQQFMQLQRNAVRPQIPLPPTANSQNWPQKSPLKTFNKIIAPPTSAATFHQPQQQQHFQFSDSYVEPVDTKKHFLLESQPPPPPAPLNHVYETIRERSPMPPPPPERNQTANNAPPPLPPSRLLKKKLMASQAAAQGVGTNGRTHKSHKKSSHDKELDKKSHGKLTYNQPPAYVAPPPLVAPNSSPKMPVSQYPQYNPQQRTKADGEHKSMLYQQLREQKMQHHQQQQQKMMTPTPSEIGGCGTQPLSNNLQKHSNPSTACKVNGNATREHPLGAHDENSQTTITNPNPNANSTPTSGNNNTPTALNDVQVAMEEMEHDNLQQLSVEQALQQAGLLPNSSSCNNANNSSSSTSATAAQQNNNGRHNRPSALPIVFEEDTGEFQDVLVLEHDGTAKLPYRHGKKIEVSLETAQAMAAAAYYAR